MTKRTLFAEIPFSILAVMLLAVLMNYQFIGGTNLFAVTRIEGILLLLFFALFMRYIFHIVKRKQDLPVEVDIESMSLVKMVVYIVV